MTLLPDQQPADREEHVNVEQAPDGTYQERVIADTGLERRAGVARLTSFVWLLFGLLEGLIAIRVVLKLIAANPESGFARFIYGITNPFLWPFAGLTATPSAGGMVLEIPSIIAIAVYALLGWLVVRLLWLLLYRPSTRTVTTYRNQL